MSRDEKHSGGSAREIVSHGVVIRRILVRVCLMST
jgi:hypothetical protein